MNNAAVAALLAVLVFVVLASVCAFPFWNCAKKEKFRGGVGPDGQGDLRLRGQHLRKGLLVER
jgi:hypothetical protein